MGREIKVEGVNHRAEGMCKVYEWYCERFPLYGNTLLDPDMPNAEVLVTCQCGAQYRLVVNGEGPIPKGALSLPIYCHNCARHISEAVIISGHSAGVFNAMLHLDNDLGKGKAT